MGWLFRLIRAATWNFFRYLVDRLKDRGAGWVRVYGGGGGTITAAEIAELEDYGVARIFSPDDGRNLGLQGMIGEIIEGCGDDSVRAARMAPVDELNALADGLDPGQRAPIARLITWLEEDAAQPTAAGAALRARLDQHADGEKRSAVVGFTGTGGAGKSSVVDELVRRFREDFPELDRGHVAHRSDSPSFRGGRCWAIASG